jgi:hypothetical protein
MDKAAAPITNCGIGSKTESIEWVEAENEAPLVIPRWGDDTVGYTV